MPEFEAPSERRWNSFVEFQREIGVESEADLQTFLRRREGPDMPIGWVRCTERWLVEGEEVVGRVSIRHELTAKLRQLGGHIGYVIRAGCRGRGLGTAALGEGLRIARELGIEEVLVTVDEGNHASRRIIEKHGGELADLGAVDGHGEAVCRYWVILGPG